MPDVWPCVCLLVCLCERWWPGMLDVWACVCMLMRVIYFGPSSWGSAVSGRSGLRGGVHELCELLALCEQQVQ